MAGRGGRIAERDLVVAIFFDPILRAEVSSSIYGCRISYLMVAFRGSIGVISFIFEVGMGVVGVVRAIAVISVPLIPPVSDVFPGRLVYVPMLLFYVI